MNPRARYASVVFDCDSTLSRLEGIDELCGELPPEEARAVAALTASAMDGDTPLSEVYEKRLAIVRPSRTALEALGHRYVETLVPGARRVIAELPDHGVEVGIVSGGLAPAVRVLAAALGLPAEAVHAVDVRFDDEGRYVDFDRTSPLWRNHGKVEVLAGLRERRSPLLFVGDGVTDLEAQDVVDLFVGFGGVVERPAVASQAARYERGPGLDFVLSIVLP